MRTTQRRRRPRSASASCALRSRRPALSTHLPNRGPSSNGRPTTFLICHRLFLIWQAASAQSAQAAILSGRKRGDEQQAAEARIEQAEAAAAAAQAAAARAGTLAAKQVADLSARLEAAERAAAEGLAAAAAREAAMQQRLDGSQQLLEQASAIHKQLKEQVHPY